MKRVKITYRGWPGHFCYTKYCTFQLNTLVEKGDRKFVVSTVGHMMIDNVIQEVGYGRYFETMVFPAKKNNQFQDADVQHEILTGEQKWTINKLGETSEIEANQMHHDMVKWIKKQLETDEPLYSVSGKF